MVNIILVALVLISGQVISFNLSLLPNAIFKQPVLKTFQTPSRSSYFGLTIVLRENSVIIGAPRAQSHLEEQKHFYETGAIFKCSLKDQTCLPYVFDTMGNTSVGNQNYNFKYENKSYQWLGGAMDGGNKDTDKLIVCASRLIVHVEDEDAICGVCYWTNNTLTEKPNAIKISSIRPRILNKINKFSKLFAQQGFSAHLTENSQEFIIGVPGLEGWRGSLIRSKINMNSRKQFEVENQILTPQIPIRISYFGYAVSSGFYDSSDPEKLYYLVTAPMSYDGYGKAYITSVYAGLYLDRTVTFFGRHVWEYFGFSALTEDVNGDGLPDVIISAPQFSENNRTFDVGALYVYLNKGNLIFQQPKLIVSPSTKPGRFGTTLSRLGDLNQDGFNDIAVGAPFENNGCVYILFGSRNGLGTTRSQKIKAPIMDSYISGGYMFGHGLSKGVDIDFNGYNDFVIGAPNIDTVFLYKAYPIVSIVAYIAPPKQITILQNSTDVDVCYRIRTTSRKQENQELKIKILLDHHQKRATFADTGKQVLEQNVFASSKLKCEIHKILISLNKFSELDSINIELHYEVVNKMPQNSGKFCEKCVAVDPEDAVMKSEKILFSKDSGCKNGICSPDLKVERSNISSTFEIGSSNVFSIEYQIENMGEVAYYPKLKIYSSLNLDFKRGPSKCFVENNIVICELCNGLFMKDGDTDTIYIEFDMTNVEGESLTFEASVSSAGKETNISDNSIIDVIKLFKPKLVDESEFFFEFHIPKWIMFISTFLGALTLGIIIYSLYKRGFFLRKRPPKLLEDCDDAETINEEKIE